MERSAQLAGEVGLATAIVSLLLNGALGLPHFDTMLAVPFGILFGIPGVAGYALGILLSEFVTAGPAIGSGVRIASGLVLATGGFVLWGDHEVPTVRDAPSALATALVRYLLVAIVSLLVSTGLQGFGTMLGRQMPFAVAAIVVLSARTIPTLVLGPVVLLALSSAGFRPSVTAPTRSPGLGRLLGACLVVGGWLLAGSLLSGVREDVVSPTGIDRGVIVDLVPAVLRPLVAFAVGPGYYTTHLSAASVAVVVAATLLFRDSRSGT